MKSCIVSSIPLSLHQVTRCLWHTSQHLHTNISNTFKHHHHFMSWKASKISALTRSPTRMEAWELFSMVRVWTKRHVHKGKEDVHFAAARVEEEEKKSHQRFDLNLDVSFASSVTVIDIHLASHTCSLRGTKASAPDMCVWGRGCLCVCVSACRLLQIEQSLQTRFCTV